MFKNWTQTWSKQIYISRGLFEPKEKGRDRHPGSSGRHIVVGKGLGHFNSVYQEDKWERLEDKSNEIIH